MEAYSLSSEYLKKNGAPWFAVMGEFHYSRFAHRYWKRSLMRMRACGIDIVSTYVIWIHHEETEGRISFEGDLDLRRFIETAGECGLKVFLRIGPWVHAEVRNGGLPDFLLNKPFKPRTNDERYFDYVKRFYSRIFEQTKGLQNKDGGPVIGVQIENEYGHCGGTGGEEGELHMRRLTEIAKEVGFDVPYFTATGWGGAVTGGLIPVMGAYCDAPWDPRTEKLEPNPNYLISYERNDKNIGSDHGLGYGLTFDTVKFPYLMAELGSALNSTYHRRIRIDARDIGAMTLCKLGGGCNLIGYYMFHGGTNPVGRLTTFEENRESGSLNDMPVFNYDGYAPIGQWGQYADVSRELRPILLFIHSFGSGLCRMPAVIPEDNPKKSDDSGHIRYSFRTDGRSGYLFINNYQRGYSQKEHKDITLSAVLGDGRAVFEHLTVHDGDYYIYPFNMRIGSALLRTAKATPLCRIGNDYVFYTDGDPDYNIEGETESRLITLTKDEACHALKLRADREYLLVSSGDAAADKDRVILTFTGECSFSSYPELPAAPPSFRSAGKNGDMFRYEYIANLPEMTPDVRLIRENERSYNVSIAYRGQDCEDILLYIGYSASSFEISVNGKKIDDGYYSGDPAVISLAYFGYPESLNITLSPLETGDRVYLEKPPAYKNGRACEVWKVTASVIRSVSVKISSGEVTQ